MLDPYGICFGKIRPQQQYLIVHKKHIYGWFKTNINYKTIRNFSNLEKIYQKSIFIIKL